MKAAPMLRVDPAALRGLVHAMIRAGGSAEDEAAMVTDHLLESNLQGHDSHGIMLLVRYVENLRAGKLNAGVMPEAVRQEASLAVFDGKMGYGQRIGRITMD
ncbi:MAG: Ldh family oxidoreductase, partial [Alphaproteobacteria bacterium]